jgi:hypothetical protein
MEVTTQPAAVDKAVPTNKEIDALLSLYLDAKKNVQEAIDKRDVFGEQIEGIIAVHGFLPPKAKKSKRIQGDEYKGTLSQSHSVEVDSTAVQRFHAKLKEFKLARVFRKLFRREMVFVLNEDAQATVTALAVKFPGIAGELQLLFAQTLKIESRSPYLEVEPLKKEKKEKAA